MTHPSHHAVCSILPGSTSSWVLGNTVRKELQKFALDTKWLIGVVATSENVSEEFFFHVALEVARQLGGRVFDGSDLVAPEPIVSC